MQKCTSPATVAVFWVQSSTLYQHKDASNMCIFSDARRWHQNKWAASEVEWDFITEASAPRIKLTTLACNANVILWFGCTQICNHGNQGQLSFDEIGNMCRSTPEAKYQWLTSPSKSWSLVLPLFLYHILCLNAGPVKVILGHEILCE